MRQVDVEAAGVVGDEHDLVLLVEGEAREVDVALATSLRGLDGVDVVVVVHILVLVLLEVEEGDEAGIVDGCEDETAERTPTHINNTTTKREVHDGVRLVDVPDLDGEVGGAGDEGVSVVVVPVHVLDGQFVAALGLQLGAGLGLGALVDGTLLGADQELAVVVLGAEVEAEGCCLLGDGGLLVLGGSVAGHVLAVELEHVDSGVLVALAVLLEFEHHDDLALEFALDQPPGAQLAV